MIEQWPKFQQTKYIARFLLQKVSSSSQYIWLSIHSDASLSTPLYAVLTFLQFKNHAVSLSGREKKGQSNFVKK